MSFNMVLIILAVVFGIAYFAKRSHRKQQELKKQTRRRQLQSR
jgi:regulatory protein YycI of two-component signal transduction system YycFG